MMTALIIRITALIFITGMVDPAPVEVQDTSPDKFINFIKKQPEALAFTIPGWFVRMGGKLSTSEMTDDEAAMIRELTGHINKLRFVVCEGMPEGFDEKFADLQQHLKENSYEPLIEARDDGTLIYLWAKMDGNIIRRMVISVLDEDDSTVVFNIKSKIDIDRLREMHFYKEWKSL